MDNYCKRLYMGQIIDESGIKGNACSKSDCSICDNLINCFEDASNHTDNNIDTNYGGYDTEIHF